MKKIRTLFMSGLVSSIFALEMTSSVLESCSVFGTVFVIRGQKILTLANGV